MHEGGRASEAYLDVKVGNGLSDFHYCLPNDELHGELYGAGAASEGNSDTE